MTEGTQIGPYRLVRQIGEGGMGEVYLARREQEFQQRVAIKLVRRGAANPEVIRRFLIERQTLASLKHPNIVRLSDGGALADGTPYLVVDYVDGIPIDRLLRPAPAFLHQPAARHLSEMSATPSTHAHRSLVVHCDLKPGNILVTESGSAHAARFRHRQAARPDFHGHLGEARQDAQRAFTLDYASPEQLCGEPVTTSTDIYALGVILYLLLTGPTPYRATPDSLAGWIRAVCQEDPEPPSTAAVRGEAGDRARQLRGDIDAIVLKALRKKPQDRYGSVGALAEDIRRHLDGDAGSGAPQYHRLRGAEIRREAQTGCGSGGAGAVGADGRTGVHAVAGARRGTPVRGCAQAGARISVRRARRHSISARLNRRPLADRQDGHRIPGRLARESRGDASLEQELAQGYLKIGDVEGNPYGANLGDPPRDAKAELARLLEA